MLAGGPPPTSSPIGTMLHDSYNQYNRYRKGTVITIHIIRIMSMGDVKVAGGTTGRSIIGSMSSCNEHGERGDCRNDNGGVEDRGGGGGQVGGQFFRGPDTVPPTVTLGPSHPLRSIFPATDASEGYFGVSGSEPATYKFPLSM